MAILNREDFSARIQERIGDSNEAVDLDFMADMMDTFDGLSNTDGMVSREDHDKLKADYDKLAKDYRDRFFSGNGKPPKEDDGDDDGEPSAEDIRIKDLFKERK